jgi:hypothetical protein
MVEQTTVVSAYFGEDARIVGSVSRADLEWLSAQRLPSELMAVFVNDLNAILAGDEPGALILLDGERQPFFELISDAQDAPDALRAIANDLGEASPEGEPADA